MNSKSSGTGSKKSNQLGSRNTLETFKDFGSSVVKNTASDFKKIGSGIFDQFFGNYNPDNSSAERYGNQPEYKPTPKARRKEFSLFNYNEYYEREIVKKEIKDLSELIRKEIALLKKADSALLQEAKDVQKIALDSLPEKPGIYHVRFLELILSLLRALRAKVGESRTWLHAMISKRKKRGSVFSTLSKKKGTQYSLSEELRSTRAVQ